MEYFLFVLGALITMTFVIIAYRNKERLGLLHAIIRIDTFVCIGAGAFVAVTSLISILS